MIYFMCHCWQYLGWSLALGSGILSLGTSAGAREGVLHPQLSLAHVLAGEVAAAGILVATVRVWVHLSWATRIPRGPWETQREWQKEIDEKMQRERGEREGERNTRLTHKWFHNRRDLYLDSIANNKRHSKGRIVLPPYDSVWQQHSAFHKVISCYRWHSKYLVSVWKRQSCKTKRAICIKRQETVVEELKYKFSGTALR